MNAHACLKLLNLNVFSSPRLLLETRQRLELMEGLGLLVVVVVEVEGVEGVEVVLDLYARMMRDGGRRGRWWGRRARRRVVDGIARAI